MIESAKRKTCPSAATVHIQTCLFNNRAARHCWATRSSELRERQITVSAWHGRNNALHLNPSKSSLLIVGSSLLLSRIQSFDISFNSIPIPRSSSIKILDPCWLFKSHVTVKCRAAYARLCLLIPFATSFPALKNSLITCYFSIWLRWCRLCSGS